MHNLSSVRLMRSRLIDTLRINAQRGLRLLIAAMLSGLGAGPAMVTPVSATSTC